MSTAVDDPTSSPADPATTRRPALHRDFRTARWVAVVTGLLGFLMAVLTPILPVTQTTAQLSWPQHGNVNSVTAPLVSYAPIDVQLSVPCTAVEQIRADRLMRRPSGVGDRSVMLSTAPHQAGEAARARGLFVTDEGGLVQVRSRDEVLFEAPESALLPGATCPTLAVAITAERATVTLTPASGGPAESRVTQGDLRPQVVGVFTDLTGASLEGLYFHTTIDSRYSTTPTLFKALVMIFGVLLTVISLVALARLDGTDGRKHRRFLPARWWRFTVADGAVLGILLLWHFIGANTSDDGYQLQMARTAAHSGYMANYFRWYAAPEAPFGMPYYVFTWMAHVTTASPWMRLPALVAGVLSWLVISREVIPRLGRLARHRKVVVWTAAAVFLAFWLPYNNGLRPEPLIAAGALLTWCSVERAIATGRLLPAAAALLIAGFTLSAGPTGTICVAALLAGSRPLIQMLIRRARQVGYWPLIAPLLASATLVLILVFGDESLKPVIEASKMKAALGPGDPWYDEYERYDALMHATPDGSVARRFAVLVMLLCLITCAVVLFRKRRVPGVAVGPARRIVGITALSLALMMFNPTKWTHHFGVYAGLAAALAALTAVVVGPQVVRSRRNRALLTAAVLFVLAVSFQSSNGWWYVSSYGVPWGGQIPELFGVPIAAVLVLALVVTLGYAIWCHCRDPLGGPPHRSAGRFAPLTIAAGAVVLLEVLSLAVGAINQHRSYSVAVENFRSMAGKPCGMADFVLTEPDPNVGMLRPVAPTSTPLGATAEGGFTPDGVPADLASMQRDADLKIWKDLDPHTNGEPVDTTGGTTASAGGGSQVALPFGLDPATTPVLGSYQTGEQKPAEAMSTWYALPPRSDAFPILAVAAAGQVKDTNLRVEFGRRTADGGYATIGSKGLIDPGPAPSWRNLRLPVTDFPAGAQVVRIVADDRDLDPDQWIAFTPPRVPHLQTLQQLVGSTQPVLLDWAVGLAFPCQRPFDHLNGVAEIPKYRILPDRGLAVSAVDVWEGAGGGGPLGWSDLLLRVQTVPTYLKNDVGRDWGSLERLIPRVPEASPAQLQIGTARRSGMWNPAPIQH
ncbi:arabinosyltransferase [Rhodococcus sp. D2-41]|uniref:Arabinosyltransferase domain-containing protein n=1 Tax=Speluncibacter jeojiensis TaxID=2710754 RepID=A0A9X4RGZ5_9ACTN|nr:arabinosyltransferase domain-containing protein [Rhodococcus sp. D2-41]MDG3009790.1 arabinosyltransferase [Rhodococcus sp. D2-41]MDG3014541.1 arabinosyltransferase domain-containing protein [Corynebacteriales bacterium D3-21]